MLGEEEEGKRREGERGGRKGTRREICIVEKEGECLDRRRRRRRRRENG